MDGNDLKNRVFLLMKAAENQSRAVIDAGWIKPPWGRAWNHPRHFLWRVVRGGLHDGVAVEQDVNRISEFDIGVSKPGIDI